MDRGEEHSSLLVEDGRRTVITVDGPEVDLQGTVTVGRGGAGRGTVTVSLKTEQLVRQMAYEVTPPRELIKCLT